MPSSARPYRPPLAAGLVLGPGVARDLLDHRARSGRQRLLHAPGRGAAGLLPAPAASEANSYLGPYLRGNPLAGWISWEVLGVLPGALAGSLTSGRFRPMVERGKGLGSGRRLAWAFAGGLLVGFGARLARGCTSSLGLSGGATLAVAAFVFPIAFFLAGFAAMTVARRLWQ